MSRLRRVLALVGGVLGSGAAARAAPDAGVSPDAGSARSGAPVRRLGSATRVELRVGERVSWSTQVWASVGRSARCESNVPEVVRVADVQTTFDDPARMKAGMTGGDSARQTFVLEAVAPGSATVRCVVEYRGSIEQSREVVLVVGP